MPGHIFDIPSRATPGSGGYDLQSRIAVLLYPGQKLAIPTGWAICLHERMVGMVTPRSGLAIKNGITVLNSPGIIDSDYRGEIIVILINHGDSDHQIHIGDRIAQLVIVPVYVPTWVETKDLTETERGDGGFGSTGR